MHRQLDLGPAPAAATAVACVLNGAGAALLGERWERLPLLEGFLHLGDRQTGRPTTIARSLQVVAVEVFDERAQPVDTGRRVSLAKGPGERHRGRPWDASASREAIAASNAARPGCSHAHDALQVHPSAVRTTRNHPIKRRHALIGRARAVRSAHLWLAITLLCGRARPVSGEVRWLRSHRSIASRCAQVRCGAQLRQQQSAAALRGQRSWVWRTNAARTAYVRVHTHTSARHARPSRKWSHTPSTRTHHTYPPHVPTTPTS